MRSARLLLAALVATLACCSNCQRPAPGKAPALTRYLVKDAEAAVVLPDLGILQNRLDLVAHLRIASFLAGTQGFSSADELVGSLLSQVGVDLRSAQALLKAGVDPSRGLGVVFLPQNRAYSVVGVKDAAAFEKTVAMLARTRLGASAASTSQEGGIAVHTYAQVAGGEPQLGSAVVDHVGFIAAGPSTAGLSLWARLPAERSLESDVSLQRSLERLSGPKDFFAYLPSTSSYLTGWHWTSVAFVGALSPTALTLRFDSPWPNTAESLKVLDKTDVPPSLNLLPPDAFWVGRFSGEPSRLGPFWSALAGPYVARATEQAGFDVKGEILDNLKPGIAVALSVSPNARLAAGMPELDVRRTNPFSFVQLSAVAKAKDPAKARGTLEKIPAVAERFGAHVTAEMRMGKRIYRTTYAQGEGTHFALVGDTLVLAAPLSQLDATLARLDAPAAPGALKDASLRAALLEQGVASVADLHQFADSVKALPASAWGIGGFAIKATTVRWLDAMDDLAAVTASLSQKGGAVEGELSLRFSSK